jgi:hypothetical protein
MLQQLLSIALGASKAICMMPRVTRPADPHSRRAKVTAVRNPASDYEITEIYRG